MTDTSPAMVDNMEQMYIVKCQDFKRFEMLAEYIIS